VTLPITDRSIASCQEIFWSSSVEEKLATQEIDYYPSYTTHTYATKHNKQSSIPAVSEQLTTSTSPKKNLR